LGGRWVCTGNEPHQKVAASGPAGVHDRGELRALALAVSRGVVRPQLP
jgi:hypothetical protein